MKKHEKICKGIRDITDVGFKEDKGILNSIMICFEKKIGMKKRIALDKCLKQRKLNTAWSSTDCMIVR